MVLALGSVHPNHTGQVLGVEGKHSPVFATFGVSFVGGRITEGKGQTDDETENGQKHRVDTNCAELLAMRSRR